MPDRASNTSVSRIKAAAEFIGRQPRSLVAAAGFLLVGLMGLIDYWMTSWRVAIPICYALPVLALAWFVGWRAGAVAIILGGLINFLIHLSLADRFANPALVHVGNALVFLIYLPLARGIATLRLLTEYYFRGPVWKAIARPVRVGQRLIIVPAWLYDGYATGPDARPTDIPLVLDPGKAFGTGTHPTTQMCLAMLETYLRPGDRVLDVGSGSGILSVAAVKLGAASALAVDVDPEAVRATGENALLNTVAEKIETRPGSLEAVLGGHDVGPAAPAFEVTVANILAQAVVDLLAGGLARTLAPGGTLILSGIRADQTEGVAGALAAAGMVILEQRQTWEWVAMAARLRAPTA